MNQKFTGKERDAETGLDYFQTRYMSSAQGRFTSPDSYNIMQEMRKGAQFGDRLLNPSIPSTAIELSL